MGVRRRNTIIIYGGGVALIVVLGLAPAVLILQVQVGGPNAGSSPQDLHTAIMARDLVAVRQALQNGADPNVLPTGAVTTGWATSSGTTQITGVTPLYLAAQIGDGSIIHALLDAGADPDLAVSNGDTPLVHAIIFQQSRVAVALIGGGADVNAESGYGRPVYVAIQYQQFQLLEPLVNAGAELNATNVNGETPLIWAAQFNWRSLPQGDNPVGLLLDLGADPNFPGADGVAPLHAAVRSGDPDSVSQLLAAGGDPNVQDASGLTPLCYVQDWRRTAVATQLVEAGADPTVRGFLGITPLHAAAGSGDSQMMTRLVEAGADPQALDDQGLAPLHYAASGLHLAAVHYLVRLGVDLTLRDADGKTALDHAIEAAELKGISSSEVVFMLREAMDRQSEETPGDQPED